MSEETFGMGLMKALAEKLNKDVNSKEFIDYVNTNSDIISKYIVSVVLLSVVSGVSLLEKEGEVLEEYKDENEDNNIDVYSLVKEIIDEIYYKTNDSDNVFKYKSLIEELEKLGVAGFYDVDEANEFIDIYITMELASKSMDFSGIESLSKKMKFPLAAFKNVLTTFMINNFINILLKLLAFKYGAKKAEKTYKKIVTFISYADNYEQ